MSDHPHHTLTVLYGGVPEYGVEVFHTVPAAVAAWESVADGWTRPHDGDGVPFDPDRHHYITDAGRDREARLELGCPPDAHDLAAIEVRRQLDPHAEVDVSEWMGCDEPWTDPVYVTATDPDGNHEYHDAVADLALAGAVEWLLEQIRNG